VEDSKNYITDLEILEQEYLRALNEPLFDEPEKYSVLLDLLSDRIEEIKGRYANF
jgi:hypothetical protein